MSAARLLAQLVEVRKSGLGRWLARCPAHEDRSPSLSIRELEDGRVLLHDFAGCDVESILAALGLQFADLYPTRAPSSHRRSPTALRMSAIDALNLIDHEAHVIAVIAADILQHGDIDLATWERLSRAVRSIGEVRAAVVPCGPRRPA